MGSQNFFGYGGRLRLVCLWLSKQPMGRPPICISSTTAGTVLSLKHGTLPDPCQSFALQECLWSNAAIPLTSETFSETSAPSGLIDICFFLLDH